MDGGQPSLLTPTDGATLTYPSEALELKWSVVPGAAKYLVKVATDPALGSLVWDDDVRDGRDAFTLSEPARPGHLLLGHRRRSTPRTIRAEPSDGARRSPGPGRPTTDTDGDRPRAPRPSSSTRASPGTRRRRGGLRGRGQLLLRLVRRLEGLLRPDQGRQIDDARHGSLTPTEHPGQQHVLLARPGDRPDQQRRRLERGPDLHEDVRQRPAGHRAEHQEPAHARQRRRPGRSTPTWAPPSSTRACPVVTWDPVPGASSYQVQRHDVRGRRLRLDAVRPGRRRPTTHRVDAARVVAAPPAIPTPRISIANDLTKTLVTGADVLRARPGDRPVARHGRSRHGGRATGPTSRRTTSRRFMWTGRRPRRACSPVPDARLRDYNAPLTGTTVGQMPRLHLERDARRRELLRARLARRRTSRPSSTTPTRASPPTRRGAARRSRSATRTRRRSTTGPSSRPTTPTAAASPRIRSRATRRASPSSPTPPTCSRAPSTTRRSNTPATEFQWSPVFGARRYRLQVSQTPTFSGPIDDVVTDSTAYTSNTTYPSDTTLYWRVRAEAGEQHGCTWSP